MKEQAKQWIDTASYEQLLRRWRNSPSSDVILQGDNGKYFQKVMDKKRAVVGNAEHIAASKRIGWLK